MLLAVLICPAGPNQQHGNGAGKIGKVLVPVNAIWVGTIQLPTMDLRACGIWVD